MDERHRRQLIDRGRRILHAFCASAEGQRKLERHRARREKCGENHILSSNQNTPRFIAEWQQGCSGTPKHGRDSEMHEVNAPMLHNLTQLDAHPIKNNRNIFSCNGCHVPSLSLLPQAPTARLCMGGYPIRHAIRILVVCCFWLPDRYFFYAPTSGLCMDGCAIQPNGSSRGAGEDDSKRGCSACCVGTEHAGAKKQSDRSTAFRATPGGKTAGICTGAG